MVETRHGVEPCHKIKGSLKKNHHFHRCLACFPLRRRHSNWPFGVTQGLIIMQSACWDAYMAERAELAGAGNENQTGNMTRCHSRRKRKHARGRYFKLYWQSNVTKQLQNQACTNLVTQKQRPRLQNRPRKFPEARCGVRNPKRDGERENKHHYPSQKDVTEPLRQKPYYKGNSAVIILREICMQICLKRNYTL